MNFVEDAMNYIFINFIIRAVNVHNQRCTLAFYQ